jgi:hypothetical protein
LCVLNNGDINACMAQGITTTKLYISGKIYEQRRRELHKM